MNFRTTKVVLLVAVFALATSLAGFAANEPCGVANQIVCQGQDGTGNLFASQNDVGGFGNFATVYQQFTLNQLWDVESFHWVGGYFNPGPPGNITAWTLQFYNDNGGIPGNPIAIGSFPGNGGETLLSNGLYQYSVFFGSFDMGPGTYWASVVPDQKFPPQWGWATSAGPNPGYQCFQGNCGLTASGFAFALDGTQHNIPEPGMMVMLGTGILGLVGTLRRKLL
jgi:hypothetical protein